eukprot:jgi/Picsp_1/3869/NSC_01381-R1_histone h4
MTRSSSKLMSVKSLRQGEGGRGRDGAMRARRRVNNIRKGIDALGKPAIRRLARRAGVKRIHSGIYEEAPQALRGWLSKMVHDACMYAEHGKRFTITVNDVLLALKRNGVTLYGYAYTEKRKRLTKPIAKVRLHAAAARVAARNGGSSIVAAGGEDDGVVLGNSGDGTPDVASSRAMRRVETTAEEEEEQEEEEQQEQTPEQVNRRVLKQKDSGVTPGSERRMAPVTPHGIAGEAETVTPERAQDIQSSLSAFRDAVIARQASSDAPMPKVAEWVSAHMLGRGKSGCSMAEMEVVLEALSERDALMITDDDAHSYRTVWFI